MFGFYNHADGHPRRGSNGRLPTAAVQSSHLQHKLHGRFKLPRATRLPCPPRWRWSLGRRPQFRPPCHIAAAISRATVVQALVFFESGSGLLNHFFTFSKLSLSMMEYTTMIPGSCNHNRTSQMPSSQIQTITHVNVQIRCNPT